MFHSIVLYGVDQDCRETLLRFEKLVIDMRHCLHFASMVLMNGYSWTVDSSTLTIIQSKKIPKWLTFRFFHIYIIFLPCFGQIWNFDSFQLRFRILFWEKIKNQFYSTQILKYRLNISIFCFRSKLYTSKINIRFLII